MNEIALKPEIILPSTIEDLSRFVLVGREKLVAVRAEIRAIEKVGLAQQVREQKLKEAQAISEAVLDAEVKIGELMREIPKATNGGANQYQAKTTAVSKEQKSKSEIIQKSGFTQKQAERFQILAANPEVVEQAKTEARENEDIVSRSRVLEMIQEQKKPHVLYNSGNNEWYTPSEYIELARDVMGSIDLDPASCEVANKVVQAKRIYTLEDDGLKGNWYGNIWLNPPYSTDLIMKFAEKLVSELNCINQAIVLVNNATETEWFSKLVKKSKALCFPSGRVKFYRPDGTIGAPLQGQAIMYYGSQGKKFVNVFRLKGWCVMPCEI